MMMRKISTAKVALGCVTPRRVRGRSSVTVASLPLHTLPLSLVSGQTLVWLVCDAVVWGGGGLRKETAWLSSEGTA